MLRTDLLSAPHWEVQIQWKFSIQPRLRGIGWNCYQAMYKRHGVFCVSNSVRCNSKQWNPTCKVRNARLQRNALQRQEFPSSVLPSSPPRLHRSISAPGTAATDFHFSFFHIPDGWASNAIPCKWFGRIDEGNYTLVLYSWLWPFSVHWLYFLLCIFYYDMEYMGEKKQRTVLLIFWPINMFGIIWVTFVVFLFTVYFFLSRGRSSKCAGQEPIKISHCEAAVLFAMFITMYLSLNVEETKVM